MNERTARLTVAVALLLAAPLLAPIVAPQSQLPLEWWGSTTLGQGFHMRVPVTVTNPHAYSLTNAPVATELDIRGLLIEAGWVATPSGDRDLLQSFELEPNSVRVVWMTDFEAQSTGPTHGRMKVFDPALEASNIARYEVPSLFFPGALSGETHAFDSRLDPYITVVWRVPGILAPGDRRFFMVYFDTEGNPAHPPSTTSSTFAGADLESLFWSGPGATLYGHVNPPRSQTGTVGVIGLHPQTKVHVFVSSGTGRFAPLAASSGQPNPFTLGKNELRDVTLTSGTPVTFKLVADRPILATVASAGFVPSLDAGMTGREFLFAMRRPINWEQDTVHFISTGTEETLVRVESLKDPTKKYEFEMNVATNQYPYTTGHRTGAVAGPGAQHACYPTDLTSPSPALPAGPGLYRATVIKGPRVFLQMQPVDGLAQVPSATGAPLGKKFYGATGWTDFTSGGGVCLPSSRGGTWMAAAAQTSALRVTTPEDPLQLDPRGSPGSPPPPPRVIAAAPEGAGEPHTAALRDRPLVFDGATTPLALFTGSFPPQVDVAGAFPSAAPVTGDSVVPTLNGPLGGGAGARNFVGVGATMVIAPYNNTVLEVDLDYMGSGRSRQVVPLGADGLARFEDLSTQDRLQGIRISADRPVLVYPLAGPPGALAGVPAFLATQVGQAEFRGYLVDIASTNGLEPLTGSTLAGVPITYTMKITNLAKQAGGAGVADAVDVTLSAPPAKWRATLDRSVINLAAGETQEVRVTIDPDADLPPQSQGAVSVRVASRGNPNMQDSLQTVTLLKRSFDVGLWFDQVDGAKTQTRSVSAGTPIDYSLVVRNQGSATDRIELQTTAADVGWQLLLLQGTQEVTQLELDPHESATVRFRVVPPATLNEGILITTVTAKSLSSAAAIDRATTTSRVAAPSDLFLDVPEVTRFVNPGADALFPVTLSNKGKGGAEVVLNTQAGTAVGWGQPLVFVKSPRDASRVPVTRISLGPGESLPLFVALAAPAGASAGETATLRFGAGLSGSTQSLEAFLQVIVRAVHVLDQTLPSLPLEVPQDGKNVTAEIRLRNRGNLPESLRVTVGDLPAGWSLDVPTVLLLPINGTQVFALRLQPAAGAPIGRYNITLALVSHDGNKTLIALPTVVGVVAREALNPPALVLAQPGRAARIPIPIENRGNAPMLVRVETPPGEPWTLASPLETISVPPGAQQVLNVGLEVPADAALGATEHRLRLLLRADQAGAVESQRIVTISIDVDRADLRVSDAERFPTAAGTLVRAVVSNLGNRSALDVLAELRVGAETVDRVTIDDLPPGDSANLSFLQPPGKTGDVSIVVDGSNQAVERDESNNVVSLDSPPRKSTPAFEVGLAVLGGAAAARGFRRARGRDGVATAGAHPESVPADPQSS